MLDTKYMSKDLQAWVNKQFSGPDRRTSDEIAAILLVAEATNSEPDAVSKRITELRKQCKAILCGTPYA